MRRSGVAFRFSLLLFETLRKGAFSFSISRCRVQYPAGAKFGDVVRSALVPKDERFPGAHVVVVVVPAVAAEEEEQEGDIPEVTAEAISCRRRRRRKTFPK